ncbi:MAG: hypothetical protein JOZ41_06015 [Chloroflexi bacterium]|nr:hypothetical protein [Chloroflexota bacterium]
MKLNVTSASLQVTGHLGPMCIACGNTRRFWILTHDGDRLAEMSQLPDGEVRVLSCGKCRSRNSIVVTRID